MSDQVDSLADPNFPRRLGRMPDTLERVVGPKPTLNRLYLERLLLNPQMKTRLLQIGGAGATREAITKAQAEELLIPVPPVSAQDEFATRLSTVQKMKNSHKQSLCEIDTLFASLQHRAFAGEL